MDSSRFASRKFVRITTISWNRISASRLHWLEDFAGSSTKHRPDQAPLDVEGQHNHTAWWWRGIATEGFAVLPINRIELCNSVIQDLADFRAEIRRTGAAQAVKRTSDS
jgi:hypothetical protein